VKQDAATGEQFYYLYNGYGDVVQIMDSQGQIQNSYTYDEWGNIVNKTESIPNEFTYAGEIFDEETGLYYLRARYYNPSVGRFISEDSYEGQLDNPLTLNLYTYTANNPLRYTDPSGHCFTDWLGRGGCEKAWNFIKQDAINSWAQAKDIHSSWDTAVDYWSLGLLTETQEYYRVSQEKPMSLEQWGRAALLFAQFTPAKAGVIVSKETAQLSFKGGKAGEEFLARIVGGESQVYFKTSQAEPYS
jgi:RHS repeat-associated protein